MIPHSCTILAFAAAHAFAPVFFAHGLDCIGLSQYSKRPYSSGERVQYDNAVFECSGKRPERCGKKKFIPTVGSKWEKAWAALGSCDTSAAGGSTNSTNSTTAPTTTTIEGAIDKTTTSLATATTVPASTVHSTENSSTTTLTTTTTTTQNLTQSTTVEVTEVETTTFSTTSTLAPEQSSSAAATDVASSTAAPTTPHSTLPSTTTDAKTTSVCTGRGVDLTTYNYQDNVAASPFSPIDTDDTPQFISLSFDGNGISGKDGFDGGMDWLIKLLAEKKHSFDDSPVRASFYFTTGYIAEWQYDSPVYVKRAWNEAKLAGHEVGLRSHNNPHGSNFSGDEWLSEILLSRDWLAKPFGLNEDINSPDPDIGIGASPKEIVGWRTPYLEYNNNLFDALKEENLWYDTSIEDGWNWEQDGTDFTWPYTLDNGSAGNDLLVDWGLKSPLASQPGLWEMPVHPFVVPPDSVAGQYGIPTGLRTKCKSIASSFDMSSGKITGFDYNLWVMFQMTGPEFLATLKYTLDLRLLQGNRAPFLPGLHSDYYSDKYAGADPWSSAAERRTALADFVDYALSNPDVRMVPVRKVFDWVRDPIPMECLGGSA